MTKLFLPIRTLHKLLRYEPLTGKLFWRMRTVEFFKDGKHSAERSMRAWNVRYAKTEAFTATSYGYKVGTILGKVFSAHRVIWAMVTGEWPDIQIDHEDHDRSNNRFVNLKEATHVENLRNQSMRCTNTSGVMGVHWYKATEKWMAKIMVDGESIFLGYHDTIKEAAAARAEAEQKYEFHQNHGS